MFIRAFTLLRSYNKYARTHSSAKRYPRWHWPNNFVMMGHLIQNHAVGKRKRWVCGCSELEVAHTAMRGRMRVHIWSKEEGWGMEPEHKLARAG